VELTTVGDDLVVLHAGTEVHRFEGLHPGHDYEFHGHEVRTLDRPGGALLSRFATVNDVHFGEIECGRIDDRTDGPIQRPAPGEPPYPPTMNRGAAAEMADADLAAVIVKGDLTSGGSAAEFDEFEQCYRSTFRDRLHVVRGNHDAYLGQTAYAGDTWIELPGAAVALMDTVIPGASTGALRAEQIEWLDTHAAASDVPVLVLGHHQQWVGGGRSDDYFGMHPDSSDALAAVIAHRHSIIGYAAGHTHRHRVRWLHSGVPSIEVGCVKDFPGTWAEYRVFEGGIIQVVHRISSPEALSWSERCRDLYADFGIDYASYALGALEDRCFVFPSRH
jgi:3',5'-cyclic-AMP phosphodiesterase